MLRIAAVNQDRGISPGRPKGAAVHLVAMREAFAGLDASVEPFDIPDNQAMASALESRHRDQPFDMIYERYALGKSTAARFARYKGVPLVLEINAPLAQEQAMFRNRAETRQDQENDRFLFTEAARVVAVSGPVAEYAIDRGAHPDSVMVCPNGIDTDRFNLRVDASAVRSQYLPENTFVLGFHGRQRPWHQFGELVTLTRKLLERDLSAHLLVVGEGEFVELEELPTDCYSKLGWQPHEKMPEFVAAFDALPLTYQPGMPCYFSPLKLMEAMACGAVPIVPDLGDLPQVVENGVDGLVYPAGDMATLESLLAGLAENPAKRRQLGCNAGERASGYSWKSIAGEILEAVFEPHREPIARIANP